MLAPKDMPVASKRALIAAAIVALVVLVPAVDSAFHIAETSGGERMRASVSLRQGADAWSMLDDLETQLGESVADPPAEFVEEVGVLAGARDVRVVDGGLVVGYLVDGDSDEVLERVRDSFAERGWTGVDLGSLEGETFVKTGGSYTWALVTTTQVGGATSVVVRSARP